MADKIVEPPGSHEPTEHAKTPKKAAASGWIGSALEYYDFFIYAQAAALVFPNLFFPSDNAQVAIVASFATFGVGYVARPIGAFVLGHWGDTHGRKNVLVLCMLLIGASTFLRRPAADLRGGRRLGADPAGHPAADPGLRGRRRDLRRQRDDPGTLAVRPTRLLRAASPCRACRPARSSRPRSSCRCRPSCRRKPSSRWGWRIPFLLSAFVVLAGYMIRQERRRDPGLRRRKPKHGEVPQAPIVMAVQGERRATCSASSAWR